MAITVLYTPDVLALTLALADYPLNDPQVDDGLPLRAQARSRACGSTLAIGLGLGEDGGIVKVGVRCRACAIGQAAAAIFAQGAKGRSTSQVHAARKALEEWLSGAGEQPDWPGLDTIARAKDYPARHGAVMLPWNAASDALSSEEPGG